MRRVISTVLLLVFVFFASSTNLAQEATNKAKAIVIPSEIYMPTIVAQPDCPLKIEKAIVGKMLDGAERTFFQARNAGSKPIVFFQIDMLVSSGGGITAIFPYKRSQGSVPPGKVAPPGMNEESIEFVALSEDLKEKLHVRGKMKAIVFFMVIKVEFEDGSTYDATPLLNSLEEHLRMFEDKYDKTLSKPN